MTIQQLKYIIALDRCRHFAQAAEECNISQPTLSTMIQKLEEEIGVPLFDRSKQPVEPTTVGKQVIRQAIKALKEIEVIGEIVKSESEKLTGKLSIGLLPTVSPCLTPEFIHLFTTNYPSIELTITETRPQVAIEKLRSGEIDVAILATPLRTDDLLEIPLYHEPYVVYFAADTPKVEPASILENSPHEKLWVLQESHCERHPIFGFCKHNEKYNHIYEAGSIDTLIRIVDTNGGYTVIPAWHVQFMQPWQKKNIRSIDNSKAQREISMVIRHDYVKEGFLNAIAETAKKIIPAEMLDNYLKNFKIRL